MEMTWPALKPRLIAALVDAFDEDRFAELLESECEQRLGLLVARDVRYPRKVREVVDEAARAGWLECLVEGARDKRPSHVALQAIVSEFLAGVAAQGKEFYQASAIEEEAGLEEDAVLRRRLYPYLETLQRRTNSMPLTGLDESGEQGNELALSRVFVALNVEERRVDLRKKGDNLGRLKDAVGHLNAERRLILLGDPGSGKSTLLRFVTHCLAGAVRRPDGASWREQLRWTVVGKDGGKEVVETHGWTGPPPVPVFVVLRDFARREFDRHDGTAIVDFVCEQLEADDLADCGQPLRELARRGQILFLLDGVDEVPADERPAVWDAISALDKGVYGGNRWVATCRILSFDPDEAPVTVPVRRLQPLDDDQIGLFIDNWYGGLLEGGQVTREQAGVKAGALKTAVQRLALRELAGNPMLLTIMALVQTFRGTLPDDRAKLYQACVETLLLRWQLRIEQGGDGEIPGALRALGTTKENLERLLWEIAWEAHSKAEDRTRSADIPRWDVIRIADVHLGSLARAEQFLDYTERRAHLLVARGGRSEQVYSFPHRTFQEYLAACHLASQRRFKLRARELAAEGDEWREVLNLAVGALAFNQNNREKAYDAVEEVMLGSVSEATDTATWRRVWLAGEMCATIGRQEAERDEIGKKILPLLRQQLVTLLANEALTPAQRAEAGDTLGTLGDPRPGVCTLEPEMIPIEAGKFIYGERQTRTIKQPFAVARYPVTVAQFGMFVAGGGYEEPRYWGGADSPGWRWRMKEHNVEWRGEGPVAQPEYWQQPRWHGENRPVVGVSWYEASAYCAWLTAQTGREYRLPTEEEWERAARHTDGREWAWGSKWEDGIINSEEANINRTTAVGCFPRGAAECGADDMSGNVWEWTTSRYRARGDTYVVRGGSWNNNQLNARVAIRNDYYPYFSYNGYGFRVVSPVVF
jgi:formylglycine-generating enzyme required for sulfatase activity